MCVCVREREGEKGGGGGEKSERERRGGGEREKRVRGREREMRERERESISLHYASRSSWILRSFLAPPFSWIVSLANKTFRALEQWLIQKVRLYFEEKSTGIIIIFMLRSNGNFYISLESLEKILSISI